MIEPDTGPAWVSGTLTTAAGTTLPATLVVSTYDSGELVEAYVKLDDTWAHAADLPTLLRVARGEVFP